MKLIGAAAIILLFTGQPVLAASARTISGGGALAFATLLAENSPLVSSEDKKVLAKLLDGHSWPPAKEGQITVTAEVVTCRAGDVDIAEHACDLVFTEKKNAQLHGRKAHELYATMAEIGIASDGAAGTVFEAISHVSCMIDPREIARKDGGGAHCDVSPGA